MELPPPERPRYSTGFRIWVFGVLTAAVGFVVAAWLWKPLGIVLVVLGGAPAAWLRYPSDWRRTWPDDFPLTARLLDRQSGQRRFTDTPYEDVQRAWKRLSPRRRLAESVLMAALATAIIAWAALDPDGYFGSAPVRAWLTIALAPLLFGLAIARSRAAVRELRQSAGKRSVTG